MSFVEYKDRIAEKDTVILFLGHRCMQYVVVTPGKIHQTKYGAILHSDLIGRRYGTKMYSKNKKGWIYLLHPTPELWTLILPHRTQILYTTDISMVLLQLDLKPGSIVVESGTGSASMSHALVRTIAPNGHLHTFEFHAQRAERAKTEFQQHGISNLVTVTNRDVLKDGFGLLHIADAVFLDLPAPWDAIKSAKQAIKHEGGYICSFSPCIEQVQRTCSSLRSCGFKDVKVMECLTRTFDVKSVVLPAPYFGPKESQIEDDKEIKSKKRKLNSVTTTEANQKDSLEKDNESQVDQSFLTFSAEQVDESISENSLRNVDDMRSRGSTVSHKNVVTARPFKEMPGHTGYLTFASLFSH